MRALLTPSLALRNPAAYLAHFKRLTGDEQSAWLAERTLDELRQHLTVMGLPATAGLQLRWNGTLERVLAGKPYPVISSWHDIASAQMAFLADVQALSASLSGLLHVSANELVAEPERLESVGWVLTRVEVHDEGEWKVEGTLPGGAPFWSPLQHCGLDAMAKLKLLASQL